MAKDIIAILAIVSFMIWIAVSREAVKPPKEINWRKMITLLSAGSLSAFVIIISLFKACRFSSVDGGAIHEVA
ncbi:MULTISPECIES: hypothetical protein [Clostridia]|uniref:hypothetical protein n=1 Tax=Clostridia TaxID=186801 RepID=UPI000EA07094|nr:MULTISPECIES: hypothetical protein [Clostridia]NBJ69242.1 hypothetical protein [Roseburia sp. 1XD42-34]RKI79211.1 hypothetical protein D7V87_07105 [Clostridium sp. 1xD42-85]